MNRIAFVLDSFVRAGSQRHVVEILKGIKEFRADIECELILISPVNPKWPTFIPDVESIDIRIVLFEYKFVRMGGLGLVSRIHDWWSRNHGERRINRMLYDRLESYDAIVCVQPFVADLLRPNLSPGPKLCFHLLEHLAQRSDFRHYRLLDRPEIKTIFMHSSQVQQIKHSNNIDEMLIWTVKLCSDNFQLMWRTPGKSLDELRITHYSRISPMRLIDRLIEAFALLCERIPARLRICGFVEDQKYKQSLMEIAERLKICEFVSFSDPVPSPAQDPELASVDLVWMISLSGHIGYAGIESMAAGIPTLCLEVDTKSNGYARNEGLEQIVCESDSMIVERSLEYAADTMSFVEIQSRLVKSRYMTKKEDIDQLVDYYIS
jgi:glycosyltransferase involved in cell wall biosynthesis